MSDCDPAESPLSWGQHRLWMLSEVSHGAAALNLVMAVRLTGPLHLAALRQAFDDVAARHEVLRCVIEVRNGSVRQRPGPHRRIPFELVDLTGLPDAVTDDHIDQLLAAQTRRGFDVRTGPLAMVTVFAVRPDEHLLAVAMHHVITDGWSYGVLADELGTLYGCYRGGRPGPLANVPAAQYRDFVSWQREHVEQHAGELADRVARLAGSTGGGLPLDRPPPEPRTRAAAISTTVLPPSMTRRLGELRRTEGGTLFMLVLTALVIAISRLDGRRDVTIGTFAAGRSNPRFDRTLGYFVNMLLVRTELDDAITVRELWQRVRTECVAAYALQDIPYEKLIEQVAPDRGSRLSPPVSVLCVMQQQPPPIVLAELVAEPVDVPHPTARFELTLEVRERFGALVLAFQYDTEVLDAGTVELLGRALHGVLAAGVEDVDQRCDRVPLAPPARSGARRGLPAPAPPPAGDTDRADTLHGRFERRAALNRDAVAVTYGDTALTYRMLNLRANRLGARLIAAGVGTDDTVGICLPRSPDSVTATLAVLKAGAGFLPLDPTHPVDRLAALVADARPRAIVAHPGGPLAGGAGPGCPVLAPDADAAPAADPDLPASPDQLAYLIYTSGSTGRPKGVAGCHRAVLNRLRWMEGRYPYRPGERAVHRTPLGFVDAVTELLGPLLAGTGVHIVDDVDVVEPSRMVAVLARYQITRVVAVPSLLRMMLDALPGHQVPPGVWVSSGEALPADLAARVHRLLPGTVLLNLYGSTEVAGDVTVAVVPPGARSVPIGSPIDGVTAVVTRPDDSPAARLEAGELSVGGLALARGYHRAPGATALRFVPDPGAAAPGARRFRTGDRVRLDAAGALRFLGRFDDQVQVRGARVEPGEIEDALASHPAVGAAAVAAWPDAAGSTLLVGYVVLDAPCDLGRLRAHLRERLAPHLVPAVLTVLDALPRTDSDKLDRRRLPAPDTLPVPDIGRTPATPTALAVGEVFATLLPVRPGGVDDDFFALGGHSILAIALLHALHRRCGVELGLNDLFAVRTIAGLATVIDQRRAVTPATAGALPGPRKEPAGGDPPVPQAGATVELDPAELDPAEFAPFPLTDVQQAYWIGRDSGFALGSVATHAYFEVDAAELDPVRLAAAVDRLVRRHPALRTVVRADGRQQVLPSVPGYRLDVADLRAEQLADAERVLATVRGEMSHQVLPAERWPLFDLRVSLLAGGAARLHVSIDALVADAYSVRILMGELGVFYADPGAVLAPIRATFRSHVLAAGAVLGTAAHVAALVYWRRRLPDLPRGPELPLRDSPHAVTRPRFRRWNARLDRAAWERLRHRAADAGLTPSTVLLAIFAEVLTRWSARPHYTLNLTLFTREHADPAARHVVGDFTSLTLLEVDHRGRGSFLTRARRLQGQLWSDLDYRAVGGVEVLREWTRLRGGTPELLAPVVFTSNLGLDDPDVQAAPLGTLGFTLTQTPQLYLDHQVAEGPDGLVLSWDVVAELFPDGVVDDMCAAHRDLLIRLAAEQADWDAPASVPLPAHQWRRRAMVNATDHPTPRVRLETLVAQAAARDPEATAVRTARRRISYRDLVVGADTVARRLRTSGVGGGELVGVACRKGPEQVAAVLGILVAGGAYLPLDPDLPPARLALLCRRTRIRRALVHTDVPALPPEVTALTVDDLRSTADIPDAGLPAWPTLPDGDTAPAYVIFTSGSTGSPKGVVIDHRGAVNTVLDINRLHGMGPGDTALGLSSLSFDLSVYDMFGVLAAGATLVLPDPSRLRDLGHWSELVARCGVTVWNSVPALMGLALEHPSARLNTLRLVLLSGDWIPLSLPGRLRDRAPAAEVISLGGATEGSIWSVRHRIGRPDSGWTSIPYGRPLANQRMHVLDDDMRPRPDWTPGGLYIAGTGVAVGYWDDPDATARGFPTDPRTGERLYRTGDHARYRPDGTLEFLGRDDQQVKISGYRVELAEVESALAAVPGVLACAVAAVGLPRGEKRLVGYYVPGGTAPPGTPTLRERLRAVLPAPLVPGTFVALPALPLTANGKLDRGALAASQALPPPESPVHTATVAAGGVAGETRNGATADTVAVVTSWLSRIWQTVLDVERVDPADNFFELGGTSLVAVRLVSRIEAEYQIRIPLVRLYEAPTVTRLATEIAPLLDAVPASDGPEQPAELVVPEPANRYEPFPLTPVQEAYWLGRGRSMRLGGIATHSYHEMDVVGLDIDRLEAAVRAMVDRHDALHTVVLPDGRQQVLREVEPYRVPRTDVTGSTPEQAAVVLAEIRARESHRVRPTGQWPLFTVAATWLDDRRTRLHVGVDLLVADAQSFRILQQELLALYEGRQLRPPPRCTFRDYQLAVARRHGGPAHRRATAYWADRLRTLPAAPPLPMARDADAVTAPRFTRLAGELDGPGWERLRSVAASRNLTPSGLLCAAFGDVLATWAQCGRFVLNLTTFNRLPLHEDVELVVGDFTSTTLLAVDATAATFAGRAAHLQRQIFRDLEHRDVSGVEALRMWRADPARRAHALAPVVFTSLLVPEPVVVQGPPSRWQAEPVYSVSQTSQVLLDHQVVEHDGVLRYSWDHVAEMFPAGMIPAMFEGYGRLLDALVRDSYWDAAPAWTT